MQTHHALQVAFDYYLTKYKHIADLLNYTGKTIEQIRNTPIKYYGKILCILINNINPFDKLKKEYQNVLKEINGLFNYSKTISLIEYEGICEYVDFEYDEDDYLALQKREEEREERELMVYIEYLCKFGYTKEVYRNYIILQNAELVYKARRLLKTNTIQRKISYLRWKDKVYNKISRITCKCGRKVSKTYYKKHLQTKIHKKIISNINK